MIKLKINNPIKTKVLDINTEKDLPYDVQVLRNSGLLKESDSDSGTRFLQLGGDSNNKIAGEHFNRLDLTGIKFDTLKSGQVVNTKNKKRSAFLPRSFFEPFKFKYSPNSDTIYDDVWGKSEKCIRTYKPFEVNDNTDRSAYADTFENINFFQYQGNLFFCCEVEKEGSSKEKVVRIYKWLDHLQSFELQKTFDKYPVDNLNKGELQTGSPDATVQNGILYIAYRFLDRGEDTDQNRIAVWKTEDPALRDWQGRQLTVSNTASAEYDVASVSDLVDEDDLINRDLEKYDNPIFTMSDGGFCLRIASGGEALCIGYFGRRLQPDDCVPDESMDFKFMERKDFRTFVSFDEGENWSENQKNFATFHKDGDSDSFVESRKYTGLDSYFVPSSFQQDHINKINIFSNVNFDLFYDKNMSSFVIVKAGDTFINSDRSLIEQTKDKGTPPDNPESYVKRQGMGKYFDFDRKDPERNNERGDWENRAGYPNSSYFVAIKTINDSFDSWELCANTPLTGKFRGSIKRYDNSGLDNAKLAYPRILDIEIVPGEVKHELYMILESGYTAPGNKWIDSYVGQGEFTFVDDSYIETGNSDFDIFEFGGKYDSDFSLFMTPINTDFYGVLTRGFSETDVYYLQKFQQSVFDHIKAGDLEDINFYNLTATEYNGQTAILAKNLRPENSLQNIDFDTNLRGFALFGEWSNATEKVPYTFNYSSFYLPLSEFGFNENLNGGSITYNTNKKHPTNTFDVSSDDDKPYLSSQYIGDGDEGRCKARLTFSVDGLSSVSGSDRVLLLAYPDSFTVDFNFDGDIVVSDIQGSDIQGNIQGTLFSGLDLSVEKELVVIYDKDPKSGTFSFFGYYRDWGDKKWITSNNHPIDFSSSNLSGDGEIDIGIVSYTSFADITLHVGDLCFSTMPFSKMEPIFVKNRIGNSNNIYDRKIRDHISESDMVEPAKLYTDKVDLYDGTRLQFSGKNGPGNDFDSFVYSDIIGFNSELNIQNGAPDSVYDFTKEYDASKGYEEIVFENSEASIFNTVNILALSGVHKVEVLTGEYNEDLNSWNSINKTSFDIEYQKLEYDNNIENRIEVSDSFEKDSLKGKSLMLYDTGTNSYTKHYRIERNYDSIIVVDRQLNKASSEEIRLMPDSVTLTGQFNLTKHFGVRLYSTDVAALRCVGEVVFGTEVDLSDSVVRNEESIVSNFDLNNSERGFVYPSLSSEGNVVNKMSITAEVGFNQGRYFERLVNNFVSLSDKEDGFITLLETEKETFERYTYIDGQIETGFSGRSNQVSIPLVVNNFVPKNNIPVNRDKPVINNVEASSSSVLKNTQIDFTVDAKDPNGQSLEYKFDFGNGNSTGWQSSNTASETYQNIGDFVIQILVRNEDDLTSLETKTVSVHKPEVDHYVENPDTVGDIPVMETGRWVLDAEDSNNNVVEHQNSLPITFVSDLSYNALFYTDFFIRRKSIVRKTLNKGQATVYFRPHNKPFDVTDSGISEGGYTLEMRDKVGNKVSKKFGVTGTFSNTATDAGNLAYGIPSEISLSNDVEIINVPIYIKGVQTSAGSPTSEIVASQSLFHSGMVDSWVYNLDDGCYAEIDGVNDTKPNKSDTFQISNIRGGYNNEFVEDDMFVVLHSINYVLIAGESYLKKFDTQLEEIVSEGKDGEVRKANYQGYTPKHWSEDFPNKRPIDFDYYSSYHFATDTELLQENIDTEDDHNDDYIYTNSLGGNIRKFNSENFVSQQSGSHDGKTNDFKLVDNGAKFVSDKGELVGATVYNETDGSEATVERILSETELDLSALSGGTNNNWENGDNYSIRPSVRAEVSDFSYDDTEEHHIDVSEEVDWENSQDSGSENVFFTSGDNILRFDSNLVEKITNYPSDLEISNIETSSDGYIYILHDDGSGNEKLSKINIEDETAEFNISLSNTPVSALGIYPNGEAVVVGDGTVLKIINSETGVVINSNNFGYVVNTVDIDKYGYIYVGLNTDSNGDGDVVKLDWNLNTIWSAISSSDLTPHDADVVSVQVSLNGRVYSGARDGDLKAYIQ